jgi:hypothetical protein
MKSLYILILLMVQGGILFSQDNSSGVYYYKINEFTYKLDLKTDSSFTRTISHLGNINKQMGKWRQQSDTIILLITSVYSNSELKRIDTQKENYRLVGYSLLRQIFQGSDFNVDYRKHIEYFANGKMKMEIKGFWKYPLNGIITSYYLNGKVRDITYFKKGKKNGFYYKFNEQGIMIVEGKYKNDKETDDWTFYNDQGVEKEGDSIASKEKK